LLRQEVMATRNMDICKEAWRQRAIETLTAHQYYTEYCQKNLLAQKQQNLNALINKANKQGKDSAVTGMLAELENQQTRDIKEKSKKDKSDRPDKSIETMFRITSNNSQRLSDQADTKANILITVNSIIISVMLGTVIRRIETNDHLTFPSAMLLLVNLVTIVFSILATRPHIPKGTFTQNEINDKKVNLLFFGNFYKMPFDEYSQGMYQMMEDRQYLYLGLMRDVYNNGVVLGKKYRMLTFAYNVFMFGLIVSVFAFYIASKFYAS
jgi:hypothetical protein